ncbi:MAG: CapA family protein [Thermodesulfobacteriota bacterium]|nr:CapA family protein [Thermodesulfobacteriota bacterium]
MAQNMADRVTLMACGDIGPVIKPVDQFAELVTPVLQQADIRFGQCERIYSKRGWRPRFALGPGGDHSRLDPEMASIFKKVNFNVVSLASNHTMDWGPEPVLDTIELFNNMGIQVVGAGKDSEEAWRPAMIERNGVKIAILSYCSVLRDGQAAATDKAGVAPMRAHTYYEPYDYQPGAPPKMITVPFEEDLTVLQEDIRRVKPKVDVVILSLHWGVPYLQKVIAKYQPEVAHAAIDAGADLILGHHAHLLKAIEVYKGKVCFYSIGNFLTTGPSGVRESFRWNLYWWKMEPDTLYKFPVDSKKTMIAKAVVSKRGVERVSFLPVLINKQAQPEALKRGDERFQEILRYAEWVSDQVPHTFRVEGDEIVVET